MNQPLRILIVDDDVDLSYLTRIRLEGAGFSAAMAHDSKAFFRIFYSFRPDLLLLDVDLPQKNGLALFLEIKKMLVPKNDTSGKARFPVMIISGGRSGAVQALFKDEGIFDYLCKPVEFETLLEKIKKAGDFFSACEQVTD